MLAQLSAWELLNVVLVVGFVAALCGWAGGAGARLTYSARLDRIESTLIQVLNRAKGAAGQAQTQVTRERTSAAAREAEILATRLRAQNIRTVKPVDQWTEHDLEAEARRRGLVSKIGS
jgi:hypothetical protein